MQHRVLQDILGALNLQPGVDPGNAGTITVDRFNQYIELVTAGAETRTVAQPTTRGQSLTLAMMTDGGACTVTVTGGFDEAGNTSLTFDDVGQFVHLISVPVASTPTYQWRVLGFDGVTGPTVDFGGALFTTVTASGNITSSGGNITATAGNIVATAGDVTITAGDLNFTAASDINIAANTAAALEVYDATTKIVAVDTRNTLKDVHSVAVTGVPVTVATEAAAHVNASLRINAKTITYTGTTTTTSSLGAQLYVAAPTFTDASTATLTTASSVHIDAVAAAGGSLTISNSRMISTSVSDCYLTNAGVWTDTASSIAVKEGVDDATDEEIEGILEQIRPKKWKYMEEKMGDDKGRQRFGIVAQELPECFRVPGSQEGQEGGMSGSLMGSVNLALAANLHQRLKKLEAAAASN